MATWTSQRIGNWSLISTDPASPWYDTEAGPQKGWASTPAVGDTATVNHALTLDAPIPVLTLNGSGSLLVSGSRAITNTGAFLQYIPITIPDGATLTANQTGNWQLLSGGGALTLPAGGNLVLNKTTLLRSGATTTVSGTITVAGSTLQLDVAGSGLTIASGGSLLVTTGALSLPVVATLTVKSGGTLTVAVGGALYKYAAGLYSQEAGAIVTLFGNRLYVAGDSVDPGVTKVLAPASGGPTTYAIAGVGTGLVGTATLPAAAKVQIGSGLYGVGGTGSTPSLAAAGGGAFRGGF